MRVDNITKSQNFKKIYVIIPLILFFAPLRLCEMNLFAGDKPAPISNADELLSRVETIFRFPEGEFHGRMLHIKPGGDARLYGLIIDVSGKDVLLKFMP